MSVLDVHYCRGRSDVVDERDVRRQTSVSEAGWRYLDNHGGSLSGLSRFRFLL